MKERAQGSDPAGDTALDIARVSHAYGRVPALSDVTFSVPSASFTVLLGLNGAGKTTLFSLISHLYSVRHGTIRILGHDVERAPDRALRHLGIVFQARTLDLDLSVVQNLAYHAALHGMATGEARSRIDALLEAVDLKGCGREKVRTLSGGQMRRIEIARALLHGPRLLLLDEATVGLDIKSRADILARIRRMVAAEGVSVLWATHLIDEVRDDDKVVVLHKGRVAGTDLARDLVARTGARTMEEAFAQLSGFVPETMGEAVS